MYWLSKIREYLGHDQPDLICVDVNSVNEAKRAKANARKALEEATQRREEVREVTTSLATLRSRNHFGESIELAMMRKGK